MTLGLHRIWIGAFAKNERALALYRRLGFTDCGRDREAHFLHGEFHDLVRLGSSRPGVAGDARLTRSGGPDDLSPRRPTGRPHRCGARASIRA